MIDPVIIWIATLALAAIFTASAIIKFADLDEFRGALENYRIAPEATAPLLMIAIPATELAAAVAIVIPDTRSCGAAIVFALIAVFTAAIAINLWRGRVYIDCGCFGPALHQKIGWRLVVRNGVLAILAMVAAMPQFGRALETLDLVTIALGAATSVLVYAAANVLLANAPRLAAPEMSDA
ncbi:MAG TPA: MauE/DoxX family redox-associated membrane protein [Candidatus Binataceae bacterium]|nr:MauE/DoxX family redox-associated membrane protein [Candidatus Binataceae bacterium]